MLRVFVCLTAREFFYSFGDITIAGEGAINFDLCSALMANEL